MKLLFHPMLVHFPIVFYFLEFLLLVSWVWRGKEEHLRFARLSFKLGYGFMLATMIAGFVDAGGIPGLQGDVRLHFFSALGLFGFYTVRAFLWKAFVAGEKRYQMTHLVGASVGNLVVFVTSFLGGKLVFG